MTTRLLLTLTLTPTLILTSTLAGCSDDTGPTKDSAVVDTHAGQDVVNGKDTAVDQQATPDQAPTPDTSSGPDTTSPKVLDKAHKGWGNKWCFSSGCHTKPVKGHTATTEQACAQCHGGNGACNPNGANSGKKNHVKSLTCTSSACHGSKHGFNQAADCAACHFAAAGLQDC